MFLRIFQNTLALLWYGGIALLLIGGWLVRDERYLVAESGIGYWLGILGGSMMLLLLIYPARKKRPRWRFTGSINFWFRLHMILGILGPALIIFHSGYQLGSLNSRVAFFCMLIVAASGLVGRYFYRLIHHGLYGEKIKFEEIYHQAEDWNEQLSESIKMHPEIAKELNLIEEKLVVRHTGINRSIWLYVSMRRKLLRIEKRLKEKSDNSDDAEKLLRRVRSLLSICSLGINEILFSYWHILHYPLFLLLVISGVTHVVVVHFY